MDLEWMIAKRLIFFFCCSLACIVETLLLRTGSFITGPAAGLVDTYGKYLCILLSLYSVSAPKVITEYISRPGYG